MFVGIHPFWLYVTSAALCESKNWFESPTFFFFFYFLDGNIRTHVWSHKFNVIMTEVRHFNAVVVAAVGRSHLLFPGRVDAITPLFVINLLFYSPSSISAKHDSCCI